MSVVILRLLYGIYFLGIAAIIIGSLSKMLFHKKFKAPLLAILLSPLWILKLFSPRGRKDLIKQIKNY